MAGHSKWANIQHRKGRQDEKRQRIWTRVVWEIMVAARSGGGDVSAGGATFAGTVRCQWSLCTRAAKTGGG